METSISVKQFDNLTAQLTSSLTSMGIHLGEQQRNQMAEALSGFLSENCAVTVTETKKLPIPEKSRTVTRPQATVTECGYSSYLTPDPASGL